jgi:cell division transport system ATP-binding protein
MDQLVDNARLCCYLLPWPVEPLKRVSEHGPPSTAINPAGHIWRGNDPIRQRHEGLREGYRRAGAEPSAGAIYVNDTRLSSVPRRKIPRHRRNIGCVFQDFKLLPNKTAAENVAYAMEVSGQKRRAIRAKVPQILDLVGLSGKVDKFPGQLSGGEQQRISIARAFVSQPQILVADEPTGNLDPNTSVGIMQLLHRINRIGTTVLVATHDKEMVDVMRKRVVALEEGRVVRDKVKGAYADEI